MNDAGRIRLGGSGIFGRPPFIPTVLQSMQQVQNTLRIDPGIFAGEQGRLLAA